MRPGRKLSLALLGATAFSLDASAQRRSGAVVYATASRLYLDAGSRDGLAPGQVLELHRAGRPLGSCKVEQVSEKQGTCLGSGRPGDGFALSPLAGPAPSQGQRPSPPPPPAVMERRRAALAAAPHEKIEFREVPGALAPSRPRAEVGLRHTTWAASFSNLWHQERVDATLQGVRLAGGFSLDVEMSARRWSRGSDPISFRPNDQAQLYVWEAALARRSAAGGAALSLGRVRPWWTPGQVIFDGAQVGWRTSGGSEAGVFGGVVPDAVTLGPSLDHGTFGAYWAGQHTGAPDSALRFFRHEARVAFVNTAELGSRVEGEALLEARITRRLDASVDVRAASSDHGSSGLGAVRVDGGFRPFDSFALSGSFRYEGLSVPELDGPGRVLSGGAARHADLSAAWEPVDDVRLSAVSGLSTDLVTHLTRRWVGPEVAFPRLFGEGAAVSAGYFRDDGWAPGQSAWLQVLARSRGVFQLLVRASWFRTQSIAPADLDELGAAVSIQAQLGPVIGLRISALGRTTLNGQGALLGGATGQSGVLDAELSGFF